MRHRRTPILAPALIGLATATALIIPVIAFTEPDSPPERVTNWPPATATVTETATATVTETSMSTTRTLPTGCPPEPSQDY